MKKLIGILSLIVTIVLIVGVYTLYNRENKKESLFYTEIYSKYNDVDEGVRVLMDSKEYKKKNTDEKVIVLEQFLKLYESSGILHNLYYDPNNQLFSFQYSNGELEGALGGVSLKEFDSMFNE